MHEILQEEPFIFCKLGTIESYEILYYNGNRKNGSKPEGVAYDSEFIGVELD
jgi:hypothetical protein